MLLQLLHRACCYKCCLFQLIHFIRFDVLSKCMSWNKQQLYREIIAVCSQIHTKHINTLCGQNVEFVNVKPGGTYNDHSALKWQVNYTATFQYTFVTTTARHEIRATICSTNCTTHIKATNPSLFNTCHSDGTTGILQGHPPFTHLYLSFFQSFRANTVILP